MVFFYLKPKEFVLESCKRYYLSASLFCVPRMFAADTHIFYDVHHTHSCFEILLQNSDLIPPFIIYIRYPCYVVRHYSDMFVIFSLSVCMYPCEYCF